MFNMIEQAQKNQSNPTELFKQITKDRSPDQMNNFYKQVEKMGFSPDIINQLRY